MTFYGHLLIFEWSRSAAGFVAGSTGDPGKASRCGFDVNDPEGYLSFTDSLPTA
jgi:hypothetical protein